MIVRDFSACVGVGASFSIYRTALEEGLRLPDSELDETLCPCRDGTTRMPPDVASSSLAETSWHRTCCKRRTERVCRPMRNVTYCGLPTWSLTTPTKSGAAPHRVCMHARRAAHAQMHDSNDAALCLTE